MNAQAPAHPWQAPAHGAAPAHQANLLLTSDLDGVYNVESECAVTAALMEEGR